MRKDMIYTEPDEETRQSLDRAIIVPTFEMTPEGLREFTEYVAKRSIKAFPSTEVVDDLKNVV
jgi:hypothetical protein